MKVYFIHYDNGTIPFLCERFTNWSSAAKFIKKCLDIGVKINSVNVRTEE